MHDGLGSFIGRLLDRAGATGSMIGGAKAALEQPARVVSEHCAALLDSVCDPIPCYMRSIINRRYPFAITEIKVSVLGMNSFMASIVACSHI